MTSVPLSERASPEAHVRRSVRPFRFALLSGAAMLITGAAVAIGAYRRDIDGARARAVSGSALLATSCGDVEYADSGHGLPVLSIHGTGGGWDQGLFIARGLVERGFRVIAPSRYGYLRTEMPANPSPEKEADLYACILDRLDIDRVAVIAASAGATPALQFALKHPERVSSLVLLVPAVGGIALPDTVGTVPDFIMNHVLRSDFLFWSAMKAWPKLTLTIVAVPQKLVPTLSQDAREDLAEAVSGLLPISLRREGILYDAGNQQTIEPYPLHRIRAPTLIASAEDDLFRTVGNARLAAARIPNAQLIVYPTGGHLLLGRDGEMWPVIAEFITGAVPGPEILEAN